MPPSEKMKLVDMRSSEISIAHQCRLLNLSRSRLYYTPKGIPSDELEMMRLLDEFYIQDPTRGTRRMRNELRKHGFDIGRRRTRRLMQAMRLKTVYCRPRTTVIDPGDGRNRTLGDFVFYRCHEFLVLLSKPYKHRA